LAGLEGENRRNSDVDKSKYEHSLINFLQLAIAAENQVNLAHFLFLSLGVAMSVSEMSYPTSYGEVFKKITYFSAAAVLLISALTLSYGMDLSPGFF